jgi:hypothetical protein
LHFIENLSLILESKFINRKQLYASVLRECRSVLWRLYQSVRTTRMRQTALTYKKNYCDYINKLACFTSFWARVFLQCSSMQNVHFWKEPRHRKYSVEIHFIAPPPNTHKNTHLKSSQNSEDLIYTAAQAWNHTLVAFLATWIWQVIFTHK